MDSQSFQYSVTVFALSYLWSSGVLKEDTCDLQFSSDLLEKDTVTPTPQLANELTLEYEK